MSKWIETSVSWLSMSLAGILALGAVTTLVQAQEGVPNDNTGMPIPESGNAIEKAIERAMISTGLDSESIAARWQDAAVWLEPSEDDPVLALFEPESKAPAKGAAVILADEGQSPASGLAGALRQPMANSGWAAMVLGLESPPYEVQEARRRRGLKSQEDTDMSAMNAANELGGKSAGEGSSVMIDVMAGDDVEALENEYRARIQESLAAAVGNLVGRGYNRVVVIGIGRAAAHATRAVITNKDRDVSELVWIAPEFGQRDLDAMKSSLGESAALKVLELHSARSSLEYGGITRRSPKQREAAFSRAGVTGYSRQPVATAEQPQPREAPALTNRISAWLSAEDK